MKVWKFLKKTFNSFLIETNWKSTNFNWYYLLILSQLTIVTFSWGKKNVTILVCVTIWEPGGFPFESTSTYIRIWCFVYNLKMRTNNGKKKPQIQSCITWFFKKNKKWVLSCWMLKKSMYLNILIFVRAKRASLFGYVSLFGVSLLWVASVIKVTCGTKFVNGVRITIPVIFSFFTSKTTKSSNKRRF